MACGDDLRLGNDFVYVFVSLAVLYYTSYMAYHSSCMLTSNSHSMVVKCLSESALQWKCNIYISIGYHLLWRSRQSVGGARSSVGPIEISVCIVSTNEKPSWREHIAWNWNWFSQKCENVPKMAHSTSPPGALPPLDYPPLLFSLFSEWSSHQNPTTLSLLWFCF